MKLGLVLTRLLSSSMDSYPQGFDCSNPDVWSPVVTNYYSYHQSMCFLLVTLPSDAKSAFSC